MVKLGTLTKDQIQLQDGLNHRLKEYALTTDAANYSAKDFYQSQVKVTSGFWGGIKAINMYNAQADSVSRGKMAEAILETNNALGSQLVQLNGAKASLAAYVKDSAWSALKNMGAQIVSGLASAGISMIISATIGLVANLIQKQKELKEQIIETGEEAESEIKQIRSLYGEYSSVKSAYDEGAASKENLTNKTDALLKALGYEEDEIKTLREKYDDLDGSINKVTTDALKQDYSDAFAGYTKELENFQKKTKDSFISGKYNEITFDIDDESTSKMVDQLKKAGIEYETEVKKMSTGIFPLDLLTGGRDVNIDFFDIGEVDDLDSAIEAYEKLLEMQKILEEGRIKGLYTQQELEGNKLWDSILKKQEDLQGSYEKAKELRDAANSAVAQMLYLDITDQNGVPKTQEEFNQLREDMLSAADSVDEYKNRFLGSNEAIVASIDSILNSMPDLSEFFIDTDEAQTQQKIYDWISKINTAFDERFGFHSGNKRGFIAEIIPELNESELEVFLKLVQGEINNKINWFNPDKDQIKRTISGILKAESFNWHDFYGVRTIDGTENTLKDLIDNTINPLKSAYKTLEEGGTLGDDFFDQFPDLLQYANDADTLKQRMQELINTTTESSLKELLLMYNSTDDENIKAVLKQAIELLRIDRDITTEVEDTNDAYAKEKELIQANIDKLTETINKINKEIKKRKEAREVLEEEKETLEEQAALYDSAVNAVTRQIDKQIDALERQKAAVEEYYDNQIDALKEEAEERDRINELREKELALEKAKNNKVRRYSASRGWVIILPINIVIYYKQVAISVKV